MGSRVVAFWNNVFLIVYFLAFVGAWGGNEDDGNVGRNRCLPRPILKGAA
jgi:hypothetical protein